jgi:hypothetical protein
MGGSLFGGRNQKGETMRRLGAAWCSPGFQSGVLDLFRAYGYFLSGLFQGQTFRLNVPL